MKNCWWHWQNEFCQYFICSWAFWIMRLLHKRLFNENINNKILMSATWVVNTGYSISLLQLKRGNGCYIEKMHNWPFSEGSKVYWIFNHSTFNFRYLSKNYPVLLYIHNTIKYQTNSSWNCSPSSNVRLKKSHFSITFVASFFWNDHHNSFHYFHFSFGICDTLHKFNNSYSRISTNSCKYLNFLSIWIGWDGTSKF